MHLHGHDFWVLGQGTGTYDSTTANLTLTNAPRRDVVLLPGAGYVVIAFYTDNPGVSSSIPFPPFFPFNG
jgi:FtsP/CotA-like multicopper oxidase with cupredoxin domain